MPCSAISGGLWQSGHDDELVGADDPGGWCDFVHDEVVEVSWAEPAVEGRYVRDRVVVTFFACGGEDACVGDSWMSEDQVCGGVERRLGRSGRFGRCCRSGPIGIREAAGSEGVGEVVDGGARVSIGAEKNRHESVQQKTGFVLGEERLVDLCLDSECVRVEMGSEGAVGAEPVGEKRCARPSTDRWVTVRANRENVAVSQ